MWRRSVFCHHAGTKWNRAINASRTWNAAADVLVTVDGLADDKDGKGTKSDLRYFARAMDVRFPI